MRTHAVRLGLSCAVLAALLGACGRPAPTEVAAPGDDYSRYPLTGQVVSVDATKRVLIVRHDAVAGYMPAMTMEFPVSAGDAAVVRPGERIRAQLVVSKAGIVRLDTIWPDDKVTQDSVDAGARLLRQDTLAKGQGAYRELGDAVPDYVLLDQDGRVVDSARFRGRQVMLNFIYSRCPVANMCPLATTKMVATQKLAREAGVTNIEFVSVTLDPAYDTPGVLREYAGARGIDTRNFSFLTGPEVAIRDLLTQFGVIAQFRGNFLDHTLATLLIDEKGRVAWRADGSEWKPEDFVQRMRR